MYPSQLTSLHQVKQNNRELTRECNEKLAQIESLQNSSNQSLSDEQTKVRDMQVSVRFINFSHPSHTAVIRLLRPEFKFPAKIEMAFSQKLAIRS